MHRPGRLHLSGGPGVIGVFLKYPKPGRVKTRLARQLGKATAARLYRLCAQTLLERCGRLSLERYYDPSQPLQDYIDWLGEGEWHPQQGRDLGERMSYALQGLLERYGRGLLVGSDCPLLDARHLISAAEALQTADVVLGPCPDGGSYLVGVRNSLPPMFRGVEWSGPRVLSQTLERLGRRRVVLLKPLCSLGTAEDLQSLLPQLSSPWRERFGQALRP